MMTAEVECSMNCTRRAPPQCSCRWRCRRWSDLRATFANAITCWPAQKCLREYKGQQTVERGFRFLKAPLFFASSVFVKKPQRVEALALIMALTLMVYTLAERKLRQALDAQKQTVLDQRKQPTAKPTFRWIMQKFQGIHWVNLNGQRQISNLNDERRLIIHLLGPPIERYYYASG